MSHPDTFQDVLDFHRRFAPNRIGTTPEMPSDNVLSLCHRNIMEEIAELTIAIANRNLPEIADAIADAIYVLHGLSISCGIHMDDVWREVHAANMDKVGGAIRGDGKVLKPAGWQPPDIAGALASQEPIDAPPWEG
jgi:predicted HAD superfamily Cof-like phosphohydrolase